MTRKEKYLAACAARAARFAESKRREAERKAEWRRQNALPKFNVLAFINDIRDLLGLSEIRPG